MAALLLGVFLVVVLSLSTAWWSYSASASGGSESVDFLPGSNYDVTCAGSNCAGFSAGSFPYTALGGSIGNLYGSVFALLAVSVTLTGLAALFGALGALGRGTAGWQRPAIRWFNVASAVLLLTALLWTATAQPGAFPPGSTFTGTGSGGASPATSFWGTNSAGTATWGAGLGWYLALASVILLFSVTVLARILGRMRSNPAPERRTRAGASNLPVAPWEYASRPRPTDDPVPAPIRSPVAPAARTPTPVAPPRVESTAMLPCPTCGTANLAKSRTCSYCQRSLR